MKLSKTVRAWCEQRLEVFAANATRLTGSAVVTVDGFVIASQMLDPERASRVAAMASSLFAVADAVVIEQKFGQFRHLLIDAMGGKLVLTGFSAGGHPLILVQLGHADVITGGMLVHARDFAQNAQSVTQ